MNRLEDLANERPCKVEYFYANGQVSMDWWERRTPSGEDGKDSGTWARPTSTVTESRLESSTAATSHCTRHYSPKGVPDFSRRIPMDFYFR